MPASPPPKFWKKLERKILFHEHYRPFRLPYLASRAAIILPAAGFLDYLRAKLRGGPRVGEAASIGVGRGHRIHLRDCLTDLAIFEQVILLGDCAVDDAGSNPEYIIDAGAHIGCASIYYALKWPGARIVAVEAAASNFIQLSKNVAAFPNIRPVHAAVFYTNGEVMIANPADNPWGFQVECVDKNSQPLQSSMVRALTMNELIASSSFPRVDILKLDIEGAEREIFRTNAQTWLPLVRVMTAELHDNIKPGCTESFQKAVADIPNRQTFSIQNVTWVNLSAQDSAPAASPGRGGPAA